jgi:hypothetical protein
MPLELRIEKLLGTYAESGISWVASATYAAASSRSIDAIAGARIA